MSSIIDFKLQPLIDTMQDSIWQLAQPGKPLFHLRDDSIHNYSIEKITTTCEAVFRSRWETNTGIKTLTAPCGFSQTITDFSVLTPLQSEEMIENIIKQRMMNEACSVPEIEPEQLEGTAKLIYEAITESEGDEMTQAVNALILELTSYRDDSAPSSEKEIQQLLISTIKSALREHPGLMMSAFANEEENPLAERMVQMIINDQVEEHVQGKDRLSRVAQVFEQHLENMEKQFSEFMHRSAFVMRENTDYRQTIKLRGMVYTLSLSDGLDIQDIKLKAPLYCGQKTERLTAQE